MPKTRQSKISYGLKKIQLKQDQLDAMSLINKYDLTIISGKAGSGKTLIAVYASLELLNEKVIDRIIITRPTVSDEDLGFLPGTLEEKMDPWVAPVFENLNVIIGKDQANALIESGKVEIRPIAYMRGQTFTNSAIIVDEAQNVTQSQMEMIIGRLGRGSKMMVCGDVRQKDLHHKKQSGFPFLLNLATKFPEVSSIELQTNHRHKIVDKLLDYYSLCTISNDSIQPLKMNKYSML